MKRKRDMATSYGALCTDFYVNQKLALKMDLPSDRETVLHFFDMVRRSMPEMQRFRRYEGELALESSRREAEYKWLALRRTTVRSGHVNPQSMAEAYRFQEMILDVAPHHLTVSPLDVDYLELMFGFDLECKDNHDEIVYEALYEGTPLGKALKLGGEQKVLDVQPVFGLNLSDKGDLQAYLEVKTRRRSRRGSARAFRDEPISIFLTVRKYGPVESLDQLRTHLEELTGHCETLANEKLVPGLLTPIARHITSSSA